MLDNTTDHEERLARLGLLYRLGQSFSAVLDLPELLVQVVNAAIQLTQADRGMISLINPTTAGIILQARHVPGDDTATVLSSPVEDPLAATIMASAEPEPIILSDEQSGQPAIAIPLMNKGELIGVLSVQNRPEGPAFPPHSLEVLIALAGYVVVAIENARLYQQAMERNLELSLLVESANAISSSLDLGRVLNAIARHMMRSLDAHWCIISDWSPETGHSRRLAEYRMAIWPSGQGPVCDLSALPCHRDVLNNPQLPALTAAYDTASPDERSCLDHLSCRRMMLLPLRVGGNTVGLVELSSLYDSFPFVPPTVSQCLRAVPEIASHISRPQPGIDQAYLFETARRLLSIADADWCTIYTWDGQQDTLTCLLTYGAGIWAGHPGPELDIPTLPTLNVVLREQRVAILRYNNPELSPEEKILFAGIGPSAMVALPLVFKGRTEGLVQLYDLNPDQTFSSRELGLARALASQAAIALENARLVSDLQRSLAEQRAMQSQLVRATRLSALGELAAVVAHQINNPLTTILGDAEILAQDLPADSPARESALAIMRAGQRARKVVERMLAMTRAEAEAHPQDVNHTIEDTLALIGPQITQQHIRLMVDLAPDLPPVQAIAGQLEDVWLNLLINAYDAVMQRGARDGSIRIASRLVDGGATIEVCVEDNGVGIAPEHIEQVFDPFFTTKPPGKGTGLGLYICHQIVKDHHGDIVIESTPGEGTCVTIRLPVSPL